MKSYFVALLAALSIAASSLASAQVDYRVVSVTHGGTISGTVKWAGSLPPMPKFPVTKDPAICDPSSQKTVDLERLIVGPDGGVANTVVYLKDISSGKAMDLPEPQQHLDQKNCRYIHHVLLVPQNGTLQMKSSDATLHTVHMDGAATFNLPFPFPERTVSRTMSAPGLVHLRCNGGHVWMNAEMIVAPHPYYAVTDETGKFKLTDVPAGTYQIVAWHEGWGLAGRGKTYDVLTEHQTERPIFTQPRIWQQTVVVTDNNPSQIEFAISNK